MTARPQARAREAAFGLLELVVVMVIVAILMSIGLYSLRSAEKSGTTAAAVAAAHAYADAAEAFAREHDGRYPEAIGSDDWPGGKETQRGPRAAVLGEERTYLRTVPEAIQDGRITIGSGTSSLVRYVPADPGYTFEIRVPHTKPCAVTGGGATSTLRSCSRR